MTIHAFRVALGEVVGIKAGYPFRGSIEKLPDGPVRAVQMKDIDPVEGVNWNTVTPTRLAGRGQADWLVADDLLFVSRGTRFYATCLDAPPGPAVCGPHLFHLRVKPGSHLVAAFLAWQINQPPFQRELRRSAEGSSQLSVRRPVLEGLSIGVPSWDDQQRIVELARLARRERQLHQQMIRNRERLFESIAESLVSAEGSA
ncbi:restriction endonuclease subunit S [Variovorax sp. J2P1-59]|uniref:restriction endonuclease subunit S n=1 Tax=Variovorax flavidus TaxID=3053501 RepID=UPI0025778ACB|nr:restriction endonuclease subunit S [Variovorax sp. J2P1-59]MDM0075248.1 restriction endonuclease subunit S [Variovorax sp. J2P1-59]